MSMKFPVDQLYVFPDLLFNTKDYTRERLEKSLETLFSKFNNNGIEIINFLEAALNPPKAEPKKKSSSEVFKDALRETAKDIIAGDGFSIYSDPLVSQQRAASFLGEVEDDPLFKDVLSETHIDDERVNLGEIYKMDIKNTNLSDLCGKGYQK